jgi:hypothetical protein
MADEKDGRSSANRFDGRRTTCGAVDVPTMTMPALRSPLRYTRLFPSVGMRRCKEKVEEAKECFWWPGCERSGGVRQGPDFCSCLSRELGGSYGYSYELLHIRPTMPFVAGVAPSSCTRLHLTRAVFRGTLLLDAMVLTFCFVLLALSLL